MICSHCGNEISNESRFCTYCGLPTASSAQQTTSHEAEGKTNSLPSPQPIETSPSATQEPDPDATLTVLDPSILDPAWNGQAPQAHQATPAGRPAPTINFNPISGSQGSKAPGIPHPNHTGTVFQPPSGSASNPFSNPVQQLQQYQYPQPDPSPSGKTDTKTIALLAIACVLFAILIAAGIYFAIG